MAAITNTLSTASSHSTATSSHGKSVSLNRMQDRTAKRKRAPRPEGADRQQSEMGSSSRALTGKATTQAPLKRGDACLRCRAKKLKCSATKPECDQCTKRNDTCFYDVARPATRLEKLEARLVDREETVSGEDLPPPETSLSNPPRPSSSSYGSSISHGLTTPYEPLGQDNGLVFLNRESFAEYGSGILHSPDAQGLFTRPTLGLSHEMPVGCSPAAKIESDTQNELHSFSGWAWPPTSSLGVYSFGQSDVNHNIQENTSPSFGAPVAQSPYTVHGMPTDIGDFWSSPNGFQQAIGTSMHPAGQVPERPSNTSSGRISIDQALDSDGSSFQMGLDSYMPSRVSLSAFDSQLPTQKSLSPPNSEVRPPFQTFTSQGGEVEPDVVTQLVGHESLREEDISQSARDYLLALFFCSDPPRCQVGSEPFSKPQFLARLALPPLQQPHPGLLFSMYTLAASTSYIPAVRCLADPLYEIAKRKVEEGIKDGEKLVDVINGCKNLSKWLAGRKRLIEGYAWAGRGVSLSLACGLHQITSSLFTEDESPSKAKPAATTFLLPPPEDQWQLCERIHAFWGVWGNEQGICTTTGLPSLLKDESILTPLPRPPDNFYNGTIQQCSDVSLRDLYELPYRGIAASSLDFLYGFLFSAVHLNKRANTLSQCSPEASTSYRAFTATSQRPFSLRQRYPEAFDEIFNTAIWLEKNVPAEWTLDGDGSGWANEDVPTIYILLKCVPIHLFSSSHPSVRTSFIQHTQSAGAFVLECIERLNSDGISPGAGTAGQGMMGSWRNKNGLCGPYRFSQWSFVAHKLDECAVLLEEDGQHEQGAQSRRNSQIILQTVQMLESI